MSVPDKYDAHAGALSEDSKAKYLSLLEEYKSECESIWEFEIVPGYFQQSESTTDEFNFNYLKQDFGRKLSWQDTFDQLQRLNDEAPSNVTYKVFFLARHGQGYHNLANAVYGQDAWDKKWSKLNGDGTMVWGPDPELTELGVLQAEDNAIAWENQLAKGCRLPTKWFSSPFRRSADTLIHTWKKIVDINDINPLIKEDFRETMGVHTCDKRSTRSIIADKYEPKGFIIEEGFEEKDIYFKPDYRETIEEQSIRINRSFQFIFDHYPHDQIINITSHSGSIRSQLLVLNHRPFAIGTGGMIPVFVKATKVQN